MLYWICPECGHECSPAVRECPTCTAPPVEQTVPETASAIPGLRSLAQNIQSPGMALGGVSVAAATAPQRLPLRAANGRDESSRASSYAAAVAVQEETPEPKLPRPLVPKPKVFEPKALDTLASLDAVQFTAALAAPLEPAILTLTALPIDAAPAITAPLPAPTRARLNLKPASLLPSGEIHLQAVRPDPYRALDGSVALRRTGNPAFVLSPVQPAGDSLADLQKLLIGAAKQREQAAIERIELGFYKQPTLRMLSAPAEIVTAPAPPYWQWMSSGNPVFTPVAPPVASHTTLLSGPQAPPLAGPSLPPQLLNFDQKNSRVQVERKRSTWPLSLLVATIMILAAVSLLQFIMQDRDAKTGSEVASAPTAKAIPAATQTPKIPVIVEHPAARMVEVAGIRIVPGPGNRPQVRYVIINHASKEVTGLNVRISVRSVEGLSGPPLFTVSGIVASLGPDESREMRTNVDPSVPASSIPDWQSLRTEVVIARQ